jgi:hypothetical protein
VLWRRDGPAIDRETVQDALAFMMKMDVKLDEILGLLRDENGEPEEGPDT